MAYAPFVFIICTVKSAFYVWVLFEVARSETLPTLFHVSPKLWCFYLDTKHLLMVISTSVLSVLPPFHPLASLSGHGERSPSLDAGIHTQPARVWWGTVGHLILLVVMCEVVVWCPPSPQRWPWTGRTTCIQRALSWTAACSQWPPQRWRFSDFLCIDAFCRVYTGLDHKVQVIRQFHFKSFDSVIDCLK